MEQMQGNKLLRHWKCEKTQAEVSNRKVSSLRDKTMELVYDRTLVPRFYRF